MAEVPSTASLLSLPAELKDEIYSLVVPAKQAILLRKDDNPADSEPALTRVNRRLRNETISCYYSTNILRADDYKTFRHFLSFIPPDALRLVDILLVAGARRLPDSGLLRFETYIRH